MSAGLYVVVVDFTVDPGKADEFMTLLMENAEKSRTEEVGCIQFDVCRPLNSSNRFFLYELYQDAEAFQTHLKSEHFKLFDAKVTPWILGKQVQIMHRISP
jgi:quinol monooxygenase YgiN